MPHTKDGFRFSLEDGQQVAEDVVGDRSHLVEIGMFAVFLACVVFAIFRFGIEHTTGHATPWWGNAIGALIIVVLYLWFRRAPAERSPIAVHVTALAATIALLIPAAYGMAASKWWLSLVGFAVVLMARPREARIWGAITLVLIPLTAILEPRIVLPNAIGEPPIEIALSTFFYLALLLGVTRAFRRVADRRARALADAAASLERANRVRNRFLAHMSHELRTPLHGVIAMTDLANTGEASTTVHDQVRAARESATVLLGLLNNILDVTRAESNGIELNVEACSIHATLTDLLRPLAVQARARGIDFTAHADPDVAAIRRFDRVRLGQIVMNLATNALKFTREGRIDVRLRLDGHDPDVVRIEVQDTGRGIPANKLDVIFEPFAQSRADDSQNLSGAGLGLSIVRELVRAMEGTVRVVSTVGEGSTFTVAMRFPVEPPHTSGPEDLLGVGASTPPPVVRAIRTPLRVLVCEDDPVGQKVARAMLDLERHRATIVNDGLLAWDAFVSGDFELLVTDVELPGIDGLELTRRIRAHEARENAPRLPIIAATAHVAEADQHRLFAAGVDAHLPKPFTVAELTAAIERALHKARTVT